MQEASEDLGMAVISVISMHDIIAWLEAQESYASHLAAMRAYRDRYGV